MSALHFVQVATQRFREVKRVVEVGDGNVLVTIDYRMNNKYLPVFLEQLDNAVRAIHKVALVTEPYQDDRVAADPNFEHTPGTGPIVPTTWDHGSKKGEKPYGKR